MQVGQLAMHTTCRPTAISATETACARLVGQLPMEFQVHARPMRCGWAAAGMPIYKHSEGAHKAATVTRWPMRWPRARCPCTRGTPMASSGLWTSLCNAL